MKEYIIEGGKGQFKKLINQFLNNDISKRLTFTITVLPPTYEQIVYFRPVEDQDIINENDLCIIKNWVIESKC
jgi:hypothetical protein